MLSEGLGPMILNFGTEAWRTIRFAIHSWGTTLRLLVILTMPVLVVGLLVNFRL